MLTVESTIRPRRIPRHVYRSCTAACSCSKKAEPNLSSIRSWSLCALRAPLSHMLLEHRCLSGMFPQDSVAPRSTEVLSSNASSLCHNASWSILQSLKTLFALRRPTVMGKKHNTCGSDPVGEKQPTLHLENAQLWFCLCGEMVSEFTKSKTVRGRSSQCSMSVFFVLCWCLP